MSCCLTLHLPPSLSLVSSDALLSHDPFAVDSSLSSDIDDLPDITAGGGGGGMGGQGTGVDQQAHGGSQPSSLMILASACHMVLAVVLTAYDEEIEELAGQVEAQMAVRRSPPLLNLLMMS